MRLFKGKSYQFEVDDSGGTCERAYADSKISAYSELDDETTKI